MIGKTNYYDYLFLNQNKRMSFEDLVEVTTSTPTCRFIYINENTWELAILTSGTLKFKKDLTCDVFMVGGGKNGANGTWGQSYSGANPATHNYTYGSGGNGGNGGESKLYTNVSISQGTNYSIVIGNNDTNTSCFNYSATSGGGFSGGNGAKQVGMRSQYGTTDATIGETSSIYAFNNEWKSYFYPNYTFGAGGGGGAAWGHYGTSATAIDKKDNSIGGWCGGGTGGAINNSTAQSGENGLANTGAGGGGGSGVGIYLIYDNASTYSIGTGGTGGTGIIIIHPSNFIDFSYYDKYYIFKHFSYEVNNETITRNFATKFTGNWAPRSSGICFVNDYYNDYCIHQGSTSIEGSSLRIQNKPRARHYEGWEDSDIVLKTAIICGTENPIDFTHYNTLYVKLAGFNPFGTGTTEYGNTNDCSAYIGLSSLQAPEEGNWNLDDTNLPPSMDANQAIWIGRYDSNNTTKITEWTKDTTSDYYYNPNNLTSQLFSLDVSAVNTSKYLWITIYTTNDSLILDIESIWLE